MLHYKGFKESIAQLSLNSVLNIAQTYSEVKCIINAHKTAGIASRYGKMQSDT